MATSWTNPTTFIQYPEEGGEASHIQWDTSGSFNELRNPNGHTVDTIGNLIHVARSPKPDIKNKTYYIRCTGYNFQNLPASISGIELKLTTKRSGRVTDDTIQLCLNEATIGENQASLAINPIKVYGGETALWGLSSLSVSDVQDPTFGVVLRFQSHPSWPHNTPAGIDSVELRIH